MSSFLAIGGVSSTLRSLLFDRMQLPTGVTRSDLRVTVSTPQEEDDDDADGPRINMFLYRTTENAALKNQMIPGEGHPSEYGHPPLSLVLHYLLTAYGTNDENGVVNETLAHFLLGSAMRVMHDYPVITESLMTVNSPATEILHESLRGEHERIKVCLDPISLEDLSKVWTALTRPYRLSAAYSISVVQIESRRIRTLAAPVLTRRIHMSVTKRPEITQVYRSPLAAGDPIGNINVQLGQEITIEGSNFLAERTWVQIGTLQPIGVTPFSDTVIRIVVPDNQYPTDFDHPLARPIPTAEQLRPGPCDVAVLVRRPTDVVAGGLGNGVSTLDNRTQTSNHSAFLLAPEINAVNPPNVALGALAGATLTVTGRRLFEAGTRSVVLVGDVVLPVIDADPIGNPQTDTSVHVSLSALAGAVPPVPAGTYPVRVMVGGVQSLGSVPFQVT
jgi:hypothetical protein